MYNYENEASYANYFTSFVCITGISVAQIRPPCCTIIIVSPKYLSCRFWYVWYVWCSSDRRQ